MEQNMAAAMPEMGGSKQQGNGLKIATAVALIIAVCGVGFGIYGMMQSSQKDNQISDLKVQIKNEDGSVTTIETPKIETTTENGGTTVTITDSTVSAENTEDYIYVGEWGIKIKKPENWRDIVKSYEYVNGYPQASDGLEIKWGSNWQGASIERLGFETCADVSWLEENQNVVCFEVDDVVYVVYDNTGQYEGIPPTGFYDFVKNPENYSAI